MEDNSLFQFLKHIANTPRNSKHSNSIRLVSWNVTGIGNPVNRTKEYSHLKHLNTDIAFLQETHLQNKDQTKLSCPWIRNIFHSGFSSKARGVSIIIINKRIQFSHTMIKSDINGRYLIVVGTLQKNQVVLVNVYAPNFDDPGFMQMLFENLPCLNDHLMIFGGDLNCVIDPVLDRPNPRTFIRSSMSKVVSEFMFKNGYVDPWRFNHPQTNAFSSFSHVQSLD